VRRRPDGVVARAAVQALIRAPSREVEFVDASGHRHRVDTRDQMGANALAGRYRLPAPVAARVAPGSMAVDCGANIGIITSQLCERVGPTGKVWAVEPVAANAARLRWLAERNGLGQLEVLELAVGAADGTATLGLAAPGRSGWASITKSWDVEATVEVPVRSLDGLLAERRDRPAVGFLKIDVEGFEFEVLDGAETVLQADRPAVYCEFNDVLLRDRGRSSAELLDRFASLGYAPAGPAPSAATLTGSVVNLLLEHR
jgi:FkbM family methyltransferase